MLVGFDPLDLFNKPLHISKLDRLCGASNKEKGAPNSLF